MSELTNSLKPRRPAVKKSEKKPRRSLGLTKKERTSYVLKLVALAFSNKKGLYGGIVAGGFLTTLGFIGQRVWGHHLNWDVWDFHMQMAIACCGALMLSAVKVWKLVYKAGGKGIFSGITATGFVLFIEASMICAPDTVGGWFFASCCACISFTCNTLAMTATILGEKDLDTEE